MGLKEKVPLEPPFTRDQLKAAIPAHCFERSYITSFTYLIANLAIVYVAYRGVNAALEFAGAESWLAASIIWPVYWVVQGAFMTGLWVLAHECGHRAFAPSNLVNDTVGLVLHSALLVPYHSWRISHRLHHSYTNHLERDQVFVPRTAQQVELQHHADGFFLRTALGRLLSIVVTLTLGWPAYLFFNTTGQSYDKPANHFWPSSPIFAEHERKLVVLSDVALLAVLSTLGVWGYHTSLFRVFSIYFVPYLIVNFWLVLITLLQHSDYAIPHYDSAAWSWVKGALCTIDRDYGLGNVIFHHIGDTHVLHHLFHTIPHYHAQEATRAIIPVLGDYYRRDDTPIAKALWHTFEKCTVVTPASDAPAGTFWWLTLQNLRDFANKVQ